jgi:hypothetical protein
VTGATRLELLSPSASAEEAAAIVAALERFMRATAPATTGPDTADQWRITALLEGVEREPADVERHPWINT